MLDNLRSAVPAAGEFPEHELERHQTLRHTVAWCCSRPGNTEKALFEQCSVFAGGVDLQSACAVAGFDSPGRLRSVDRLDALVADALLSPSQVFKTDQVFDAGDDPPVRGASNWDRQHCGRKRLITTHTRLRRNKDSGVLALGLALGRREAWDGCGGKITNLRTAFRIHI